MKIEHNKWGDIASKLNDLNDELIRNRLLPTADNQIENPYPPGLIQAPPRLAAVLIPMLKKGNTWHILFIRRTKNQHDPHSGQVAYPGGAADKDDLDAIGTALRETKEEIGIDPREIKILGKLNLFHTITNYLVTPVVAHIPWPHKLELAPQEVSRAFAIPLEWLASSRNFEIKTRQIQGPFPAIPVIYYKPYDSEVLWGASARITMGLLDKLFDPVSIGKT